jgi:sigma-B regulation protein RsbU (phosphoserine phosphatase)
MEIVDWDMDTESPHEHESFGETQVGSVTEALEPVHSGSPLGWVAEQFQSRPTLAALPVEHDGGVVGLVTRTRVLERASKFLENLSSRSLDHDLTPHGSLDARESVDKVVSGLFADESQPLTELFLVYLDGQYYGVASLRKLISRAARLRDQDLAKAQEVQQGALARQQLPVTRWERSRLVRMAYGVGGDHYQELAWSDGTCFLGCFDVSGKGISGSLVTSALGGFFSAVQSQGGPAPDLTTFAHRINDFLREILPLGTFVTAVLFLLPAQPGASATLEVLNFGFGPVYYYARKDNKVAGKALRPNLPPLGLDVLTLDPAAVFPLPLEPGTKVYAFSDGLSDLMSPDGKRYGEDQLRTFLSKVYKYTAPDFLTQLEAEIAGWQSGAPQADDITALTIQA